jgi:DNA-binding MarR family transcriptional regulator
MADIEVIETLGEILASEIRVAVARLASRLRQEWPPPELGLTKMSILSRCYRLGASSPKDLADAEQVQSPSMTRALAALAEDELVARGPHSTDGRQIIVTITAAGRALVRSDRRHRHVWLSSVIEEQLLSPIEREFLGVAAKLLGALSE